MNVSSNVALSACERESLGQSHPPGNNNLCLILVNGHCWNTVDLFGCHFVLVCFWHTRKKNCLCLMQVQNARLSWDDRECSRGRGRHFLVLHQVFPHRWERLLLYWLTCGYLPFDATDSAWGGEGSTASLPSDCLRWDTKHKKDSAHTWVQWKAETWIFLEQEKCFLFDTLESWSRAELRLCVALFEHSDTSSCVHMHRNALGSPNCWRQYILRWAATACIPQKCSFSEASFIPAVAASPEWHGAFWHASPQKLLFGIAKVKKDLSCTEIEPGIFSVHLKSDV